MTSRAERRFRRALLVTAMVCVFGITGAFGWTMLQILSNLREGRAEARASVERLVDNQTAILKRLALNNRKETRENRRQLRRLILKVEDDLRVILEELGGDPSEIPPAPEPSGANNPPKNNEPEPKKSRPPEPEPSPSEDPEPCTVRVGPICVRP